MRKITQKWAFLMMTLVCLLGMSSVVTAQTCVEFGDGTTAGSAYLPAASWYHNSYTQQLFLADELELSAGNIVSIGFQYNNSTSMTREISIYMANTDVENLSSDYVRDDLEEVLSPTLVTFDNSEDWFTIELETPFAYDGSSNLVVAVYMSYSSSETFYSSGSRFLTVSSTGMTRYQTSDTQSATAIVVTNGVPSGSGSAVSYRTNTQFCVVAGGSTTIPCDKPSGITASDVTAHGATLTWAEGSGVYNVEYKKDGDADWTPLLTTATTLLTTDLTGLEPNTNYQARVQSVCAGNEDNPVSKWVTCSFKTLIGIPYAENFDASSSLPTGWVQKSGLLTDIMSGSTTLSSGSGWSVSTTTCANFTSNHLYQNVYGSSKKQWIVLPRIPMEANTQLTFDLAITRSSCAEKTPGAQDDDKFVVLISTDSMATWTILRQWDNAGSAYVFDNISNTGEEVVIELSAYTGENAHIALYAESTSGPTTGAGDNYFHIDNILIDYIPRCLKPTDLKAENITTSQAELSWTANSNEEAWILDYKKSAEEDWQSINVTENPYTLGNLDAYTAYDFRVSALCDNMDEFGTSKYSSEASFKTHAAVPFVEAFTSMPSDWKRYSVLYETIAAGEDTLTNHPVSSGWTVTSGQGVFGTTSHLKLQVYGENVKNWIVSPLIEMNDAPMQLTFDLALTKNTGTLTPAEAGQQDDDKFSVLVTTDGGETWEEVYVRDNVTSADSYDNINCSADGQIVKVDLSEFAESTIAIAFYGESTVTGGNNYLHIRNFDIDTIPACEKPMGLAVSDVSSSAASFSWDEAEGATWAYGIVANPAEDFVPTDEDFTGTTEEYLVTIDTLAQNTPYTFFLRRACGGSNSEFIARRFQTEQTPAALPFADDFENGLNWVLINGDIINQWVLGEAAHNGEGTHALYISNDGGTSNEYTNSTAGITYATKSLEFPEAGIYSVSFDWRANGESTWDVLCVALVPDGTLLEAGSVSGQWALPTGWTALHEGAKLNLQTTWQHSSYELNIENEGVYKVVMVWRNDGSGGTNPPAAVDNFSIVRLLCPAPTALAEVAETATTNSVQVEWMANGSENNWLIQYKKATAEEWTYVAEDVTVSPFTITGLDASSTYNVRVAAWCDPTDSLSASEFSAPITVTTACASIASFPYAENFDAIEGTTSGSTSVLPVCWTSINTSTYSTYNGYPNVYSTASYANSGTNSLKFYSYAYSSTYDPQDQYAILPEMEGINTLRMKFNARAYSTGSSYDATFTVGVMSDPTDTATFVPVATMEPAGTAYEPFEVRFNTYEGNGKYIAIKMLAADLVEADYVHGFYMDDIVIDPLPSCFEPMAVKVLGATATSVQFTYTAEEGDSLSYAIVLKGVEPTEFIGITADTMLVEGLEASAEYVVYLRTECANSASVSISAAFQTKQLPIDLGNGFADDFEGANQWYFFNTDANAWVLGEAAHNGEGTHAMYVSNDGGATNSYNMSGPGIIYATKMFNIASGSYVFQFDWKAKGEGTSTLYDYMRVALVPASAELAGGSVPTGFGPTALPEGCIAVDNSQALNQVDAWQTFMSNEVAVPAGTYYLAFAWKWDVSGGTNPAAAVDNVTISKILCGKPGTPTIEKANITASSAEIAWEAEEGQTAWQIAMDTIAAFSPDTAQLISTNVNPYLAENLLPEHTYYVYVRANCGEDGFSAWSARASFKTAKACQKPDGLDVTAITDSSAVVTWNTYGQNDFILTYGIGNAYADTVRNITSGTYTITGLDENTSYKVKVAAACDENTFSSAKTFKTACSAIAAVVENFDGIIGSTSSNVLPDCWSYINGGSSYGYLPTVYAGASYANSGTNSLRFYSYSSSSYADQYAILPAVNNLNTLRMKLNARKYSASYEGIVVVGIMTDPTDVATFVAIDTVAPAGVAYEPFVVSFGEYTGEGLYVALKSPLPVTSSYNGSYIDDIAMEAIPSCLEPEALAASNIATTSATLDWTSTASQWQILLNNDSANLIDVAAKPFAISELTPATVYTFAVRAICAVGDTSAWSKSMTFATECELISLAAADYVEGFEAYQGSAYNDANGEVPVCWEAGTDGSVAPHVIGSGSYYWTHEGTKALTFYGSGNCFAIMPKFAEPLNTAQISFWAAMESATNGTLYLGYITEEDPNTFNPITTYDRTVAKEMAFYETSLDTLPASASQLVFLWSYNSQWSCCIDEITVSLIPSCPKTTGLEATIVGDVTASFAWDAEEDVTWEYGFVVDTIADFVPADSCFTGIATINEATINGLLPETDYLFFIRKICGNDKSPIIYKSFSTVMLAAALPYDDDFEGANNWQLINGTCTNAWTVGTAATENGNALYISNDGGTTFEYTLSTPSMVYAAKAFNFDKEGSYTVSYDWRANGESTYDYLRVAIVPATVELAAATSVPSGFGPTGLPTGWKAADGGSKLNLSNAWQSKSVTVENIVPGYYMLVFAWRNDNSTGAQNPAAVDNIHIQHLAYPTDIEGAAGIESQAVKFIYNDQVYILLNGAVYNITGQKVELK